MVAGSEKLPLNLPLLQNLIKRDPDSYKEEFDRQYAVYEATKNVFELNPTAYNVQFAELIMFFSQVAHCFVEELETLPQELVSMLERHGSTLHPEMRLTSVKALVLLRNKNLLSPTALLELFFKLLRSQDKNLRAFLQQHIVTDIKNINSKGKNMKLNRELQNFMYKMLEDNHAVAIKMSLDILIELYRKQVWNDAKTVNIIASACFSKVIKVVVAAVKFFIGFDEDDSNDKDSDSDSDMDDAPSVKRAALALRVSKANKSKKLKQIEKAKIAQLKLKKKKKTKATFDFSAIHLIHDPQNLAERLYKKLEKMNERFEVKLMVMNFISRLIGIHQLYLPNFYPFLQRYLYVHQRDVTKIMMFAAQAAHPLVPPDDLEPLVRTLADNFVTERYSSEVMAMGLNAIREVCARNSFCMNEDLLQDLAQYKTHKDKAVIMASRSLIALFREKNPSLLAKKDRGLPTELAAENKTKTFGSSNARDFIPGAEILTFNIEGDKNEKPPESDSDEGDWMDVSNDGESDSEEESHHEHSIQDTSSNPGKSISKKEAIKEIMKLTPEERAQKSTEVLTTRLLTDKDFANIEAAQAAKEVERYSASRKKVSKRKREMEDKASDGEIVSLKNIEMIYKKRKNDKDARIQSVLEGREGREKFGSRKQKMNEFASTTNKQKKKNKNFMMLKHKIKSSKKMTSFRDKQAKLKKSLLKQQKYK